VPTELILLASNVTDMVQFWYDFAKNAMTENRKTESHMITIFNSHFKVTRVNVITICHLIIYPGIPVNHVYLAVSICLSVGLCLSICLCESGMFSRCTNLIIVQLQSHCNHQEVIFQLKTQT